MEHEFWHDKWQKNQIGFHLDEVNRHLAQQWSKLEIEPNSRVLVPMCGKSNDMLWLLAQGYQVLGVELSPLAVAVFFSENQLQPNIRQYENFTIYEIDGLQIWCGDFFSMDVKELGKVAAIYDRGALVALPKQMRSDYAKKISEFLSSGVKILLIAFEYLQHEMSGPPFSVSRQEIESLYSDCCNITLILSEDVLEQELNLKSRGLTQLHEQVYSLTAK